MRFDLSTLPDFPSLQQLARALWRNGSLRGAAVLVGAGFSKNADRLGNDSLPPPLWADLTKELKVQLYPPNGERAPANPLRLAEEYRTYFGQAALDDFIRTRFPDQAWQPGRLHLQLLNLPWSDVLTTNWDTLLERAAQRTDECTYELVRFETDLPHARSPRIVKLHGTLGDAAPLIFAEEDYRTYPAKHAAYVNLARQIFIENELCLIGFSGEDPNFLQWAGWVRDHLGGTARRIYLVGCLDLPRATRKFLEAHNIAPIDFAPAVKGLPSQDRHAAASELFFEAMLSAKPSPTHEWLLTSPDKFPLQAAGPDAYERARKDDVFAAELLAKTSALARTDRQNYPGWFVCPGRYRGRLASGVSEAWLVRPAVLARFGISERSEILSELLWRRTTCLLPVQANLRAALIDFLGDDGSKAFPHERLDFAVTLMRDARLAFDGQAMESWGTLIDAEAAANASHRIEAQYQRCLRSRDILDLQALAAGLERINSNEPVWKMRRAALHCELAEDTLAAKLIREATAELDERHRLDRTSLWIKSQLGWASWLLRNAEAFRQLRSQEFRAPLHAREFTELLVDPSGEIERIQDEADRKLAKHREEDAEVTPLFEPGHYRAGSDRHSPHPLTFDIDDRHELDLLIEAVGIPLRINHVGLCGGASVSVSLVTVEHRLEWFTWILRSLHSHFDKPFIRYFSRIAVAQLPSDLSERLISVLGTSVRFWADRLRRTRNGGGNDDIRCAIDRMRLSVAALSRLTVRMTEAEAKRTYLIGMELAQDPVLRHPWLTEALGDLVKYAAHAVSREGQGDLALAAIEFPLITEAGTEERLWPDPVRPIWDSSPVRRGGDSRWNHRVQQLIAASHKGLPSRKEAVLRLTFLALNGALLHEESRQFAEVLWSELDAAEDGLPANTGLIPSAIAQLPFPSEIEPLKRLERRLLSGPVDKDIGSSASKDQASREGGIDRLMALANLERINLRIPPPRAAQLFDRLMLWSPPAPDAPDSLQNHFSNQFFDKVRMLLGEVLSRVVVPAIAHDEMTNVRGEALIALAKQADVWGALVALPHFLLPGSSLGPVVETLIRRGLTSFSFQQATSASLALVCWGKLARRRVIRTVPRTLIEQLVAAIEARHERGLHVHLQAAGRLYVDGFLKPPIISRLVQTLEDLRVETRYDKIALDAHAAITASLVRVECAKLARLLLMGGREDSSLQLWIDDAANDALPEVRFSIEIDR